MSDSNFIVDWRGDTVREGDKVLYAGAVSIGIALCKVLRLDISPSTNRPRALLEVLDTPDGARVGNKITLHKPDYAYRSITLYREAW